MGRTGSFSAPQPSKFEKEETPDNHQAAPGRLTRSMRRTAQDISVKCEPEPAGRAPVRLRRQAMSRLRRNISVKRQLPPAHRTPIRMTGHVELTPRPRGNATPHIVLGKTEPKASAPPSRETFPGDDLVRKRFKHSLGSLSQS